MVGEVPPQSSSSSTGLYIAAGVSAIGVGVALYLALR
jgi:hypothetical protein